MDTFCFVIGYILKWKNDSREDQFLGRNIDSLQCDFPASLREKPKSSQWPTRPVVARSHSSSDLTSKPSRRAHSSGSSYAGFFVVLECPWCDLPQGLRPGRGYFPSDTCSLNSSLPARLLSNVTSVKPFFLKIYIYGCSESCWKQVFSSCGKWGLLSSCSMQAFHFGGLSCCTDPRFTNQ